jgi:primosomal replication protein N
LFPIKLKASPDLDFSLYCNHVEICGKIIQLGTPRYTPAGIIITELKLGHQSNQTEAGSQRKVVCELPAIAIANVAEKIFSMGAGSNVKLVGFLAAKGRMSDQLILHVRDATLI